MLELEGQRARRVLAWTFAALALATWMRWNVGWDTLVAERLDHCPEMACDFVHHYLPQVRQLFSNPSEIVHGWLYPPFLALLLQFLRPFSDSGAVSAWMLLQFALAVCLVVQCRGALRSVGRWTSWAGALGLVFLSLPVLHSIKWGQVSLLVCVVSIWALGRMTRIAAVVFGALAAIKIYPILYAVPWIWLEARRGSRRRALVLAGWVVGSALVLGVLLPLAVLGPRLCGLFAERLVVGTQDLSGRIAYLGGQAFEPTLVRWFVTGRHPGIDPESAAPLLFSIGKPGWDSVPGVLRSLAIYLPAVVLVFAAARRLRREMSRAEQASLVLLTVGLALPPGWHHYFAFLPFALATALVRPGRLPVVLAGVGFLACALPLLLLAAIEDIYFELSPWGPTMLAALAAWVALVVSTSPDEEPTSAAPCVAIRRGSGSAVG